MGTRNVLSRCRPLQAASDVPCGISLSVLHERVIHGDAQALDELAERLLPALCRWLRRRFVHAAEDVLVDASEDAIVEYASRPTRFDSERGVPLEKYLYAAAWRNAVNSLQREARRRAREARYATGHAGGERRPARERSAIDADVWKRLLAGVTKSSERAPFLLWLNGERRTKVLAAALGCRDLSPSDQRREVKRLKDRVMKRLNRLRTPALPWTAGGRGRTPVAGAEYTHRGICEDGGE
jgi:RNA polymerase sigma-70 factor (ECF subfamily)